MWQVVGHKPKVQKEDGKGFSVIIEFELDPGYVPLVMAAISNWQGQRLYLAARYNGAVESMNASFIYRWESCGRAVPFLWKVKEHKSSTVARSRIQINVETSTSTVI